MVYPYSVLKKKDRALYGEDSEDLGIPPAQPVVPDSENIAVEPPAQKAFDPQAELYNYLMQRKRSRDYDLTPEAMAAKNARSDASAGMMAMNTLIPTLEKAGAEIGTVGGRTAKTILDKPSDQWIKYWGEQDKNALADRRLDMDQTSMDDRLVEYLMNQQRQKEEADTGRAFQLEKGKIEHGYGMEKQAEDNKADMAKLERQQQWKSGEDETERGWKSGENEKDRAARIEAARLGGQQKLIQIEAQGKEARKTQAEKPVRGAGKIGGKPLTSTAAGQIGSYNSALEQIGELEQAYNSLANERGSGIKSLFPGSNAANYEVTRKQYAQGIGKILEKGKLTDADYERKYIPLMPGPWDPESTARIKLQNFRNMIESQRRGEIEGYGQAGFDVSGYGNISGSKTGAKTANSLPSNSKAKLILEIMKKKPAALADPQARKYIIDNAPELKPELDELIKKSGNK